MRYFLILNLALLIIIVPTCLFAFDLTEVASGAASLGMGGITAVLPEDTFSFNNNPAGLAFVEKNTLSSMYGTLMGSNYLVAGGIIPLWGNIRVAVSYSNLSSESIPYADSVDEQGHPLNIRNISYSSSVISASTAVVIKEFIVRDIALGFRGKYFFDNFSGLTANAKAINFDIGGATRINQNITFGLIIKNALPAQAKGSLSWNDGIKEDINNCIIAGLGYSTPGDKIFLGADARYSRGYPITYNVGTQYALTDNIALRAGLAQTQNLASTKFNWSAGLGLNFSGIFFDYAYHTYGDEPENNTHYFSLGVIF